MGLLDEILEAQTEKTLKCPIAKALRDLSKEDAEALEVALGLDTISAPTITGVLRTHGYSVGVRSVGNHRRGACGCSSFTVPQTKGK